MRTTGEIIKSYMYKKYKRDDMAEALGITPQYLSNLLSNKKNASKKLLSKLITFLDIVESDVLEIYNYERSKKKEKTINLKTYSYSENGIATLSKNLFLNELFEKEYIFIVLKEDFLDYKEKDILVFKKYENEDINNKYILLDNQIYFCRKSGKNYILESFEAKMLKKIQAEYILLCSINRN